MAGGSKIQHKIAGRTDIALPAILESSSQLLSRADGAHRASSCASAAVNAKIRVNVIYITLRDSSGRALADAGAASYTISF